MREPTSVPRTSLDELKYEHGFLKNALFDLRSDIHAALARLECLEQLDSLAFIRADIEAVRQAVGSANSNMVSVENAARRMLEVAEDGWEEEN